VTTDSGGRVLRLAEQYREQLLARDARMLQRQARAILATLRRLDARILALAETVSLRAAAGEPTTPGSVVRLEQWRELWTQLADELARYVNASSRLIAQTQATNIEAAIDEAARLAGASLPAGVTWGTLRDLGVAWSMLDPDALQFMVGRLGDGSPLRAYLARRVVVGTIGELVEILTTGIVDNPRLTARRMRERVAGGMGQALRIARTETLRSYRDAARAAYAENPRLVRGYRRRAALDHRTCVACWLMDGVLYPNESDLEEHIQGRCYLTPELVPMRELGLFGYDEAPREVPGRQRFLALPEASQRRIVGNDRQFELLRSGQISLADLIQRRTHPDFGAQLTQASARASLAGIGTLEALPPLG
jgi:hypothetical protein